MLNATDKQIIAAKAEGLMLFDFGELGMIVAKSRANAQRMMIERGNSEGSVRYWHGTVVTGKVELCDRWGENSYMESPDVIIAQGEGFRVTDID
ncbi:hypothetical protein [Anaerohalosphaera lusitana]|nr:hypothetical protein [Anaerohalosphaera lusitana]